MTDYTCALCGKPTEDEARINDDYYCHSQDGTTCYMKANWALTFDGRADGCYTPKRALERLGLLELATTTKDKTDD